MKKIITLATAALVSVPALAAQPSHIARDGRGGYDVMYSYKDKPKNGWYAGAHAAVNLMSWKYKGTGIDTDGSERVGTDSISLKPLFGGAAQVGKHFAHFWRGELEGGFMGQYSKTTDGGDEKLSLPYVMLNGYYDFLNGLYLGAGVGVAFPIDTRSVFRSDIVDFETVTKNFPEDTKTFVSPMAGLMVGYSHKLDDNLTLDLRYRLAGVLGFEHKIEGTITGGKMPGAASFKAKTDYLLDNAISVGLRYEF